MKFDFLGFMIFMVCLFWMYYALLMVDLLDVVFAITSIVLGIELCWIAYILKKIKRRKINESQRNMQRFRP